MRYKNTTWEELEAKLNLTPEEEAEIDFKVKLMGKLLEVRKEKGLTQEKLAEISGLKQSFIARLEKDSKRALQVDTLLKILLPLGYEIDIVPIKPAHRRIVGA
ncbi:MAG: helix-turn-helix domain-containing protein [Candidatus Gastranaerophilaceae bacterium]